MERYYIFQWIIISLKERENIVEGMEEELRRPMRLIVDANKK
ncbi:hypothetical protein [Tissierella sp.]|nr:hypothetical protein [Tissierella sp.]